MTKPFLKWAGGKRSLLPRLTNLMPNKYKTYFEPFLGGGALFFSLQPNSAFLSDSNAELIQCYKQIAYRPKIVIELLKDMKYNKKTYYETRKNIPTDPGERAARFIYLNRCCWNGLYRVNRNGEFNVPIGGYKKSLKIFNEENLLNASKVLRKATITLQDFEDSLTKAGKGDFVYLDPPYTVKHGDNGFLLYNEKIFSWHDQERLVQNVHNLVEKGVNVMISNGSVKEIKKLYKKYHRFEFTRSSIISGIAEGRGRVKELVITSYKPMGLGDWI